MKEIELALVQMNSVICSPESNYRTMEKHVRSNPDSDIICFPEMCLSGYTTTDPERTAISPDDPIIKRISDLSKDADTAIVFGYLEHSDGKPCMRQEIIDGDSRWFYRKSHLGKRESEVFTAGNELPVFDVRGVKVGIQLCIESHTQEICSTYRAKGAELVLTPFANGITGERRKAVWNTYMPSRASDNGMYVAACSAIGDNGEGNVFGGGLLVLDPKGYPTYEYYGADDHSVTVKIGGNLPRDGPETMSNISYFDRRRPELYK